MAAVDEVFEDVQSGGAMDVSDASGNGSVHGPGDGRLDAELHMEESSPRRAGDAGGTILWDGTKMALHQALDALPMERRMQQLVAGGFGLKAVDVFDERTVRRNEVAAAAAAQAEADGHDVEAAVESAIFATTPTPEDMLLGQR